MNANTPLHLLADAMPRAAAALTLDQEPVGRPATVAGVTAAPHAPEWADWLADLGFIPGERVMITARGLTRGDPLAVRIGSSTFALRRAEAACIQIRLDAAPAHETRA